MDASPVLGTLGSSPSGRNSSANDFLALGLEVALSVTSRQGSSEKWKAPMTLPKNSLEESTARLKASNDKLEASLRRQGLRPSVPPPASKKLPTWAELSRAGHEASVAKYAPGEPPDIYSKVR
jgi:hypothetical protein